MARLDFELNIPRGAKQRSFLDYLNAALRERMPSGTGTTRPRDDGLIESEFIGAFRAGDGSVPLCFKAVREESGALLRIEVDATAETSTDVEWASPVQEFMHSVMAAAFAENKTLFFRRVCFSYIGSRLDGEYWISGWRFAPIWPGDDSTLINAERVVSFDTNIDAVDMFHASRVAVCAAKRLAARMSLLLNVGLFAPANEVRWGLLTTGMSIEGDASRRFMAGFAMPSTDLVEMPKKGAACPLGHFTGSLNDRYRTAGENLCLPKEARRILRSIDDAEPRVVAAFDHACRLYQVAATLRATFPSVASAYRVAAIDAAVGGAGTRAAFARFIRQYVKSREDLEPVITFLWRDIRSAHFHGGSFPLGEYDERAFFDMLPDTEGMQFANTYSLSATVAREALVNWVLSHLGDDARDDATESE